MLQLRNHEGKAAAAQSRPGSGDQTLQARVAGLLAGLLFCATAAAAVGESGAFKTLRLEGNAVRWQLPAQGPWARRLL